MRKEIIKNETIKKVLKERELLSIEMNKLVNELEKVTKKSEALKAEWEAEFNKAKPKVEALNEKMTPIMEKFKRFEEKIKPIIDKQDFNLGEFEEAASVYLENGEVVVKITDEVEEYAKILKHKKNEKSNSK